MKVLHINTALGGGAGIAALRICEAMRAAGIDSKLLTLDSFDREGCLSYSLTQKQIESLCHLFANEVLIPRNTFKDAVGDISSKPIHIDQFVDLQMLYGVSIDALMYKAMKLEMIPQSRYIRYRQRKNKDARFKQIIDESRIGDEKSDRFESLVYKAYAGDIISLSKAASLLQVPESDIRQVYV